MRCGESGETEPLILGAKTRSTLFPAIPECTPEVPSPIIGRENPARNDLDNFLLEEAKNAGRSEECRTFFASLKMQGAV